MSVYKDKNKGTWYTSFRYTDWSGERKQTMKRGFKTKKEALAYETEFKRVNAADFDMTLESFVVVYFEDKKNSLKEVTVFNKRKMIDSHLIPYFGDMKMNEITAADIIKWQNIIQEKGFKPSYERNLHNQISALFNHASRIYNLKDNPCKKVPRMGKSDGDKFDFWTKDEYDIFISVLEKGTENYIMFEILYWTGIRLGELLALTPRSFDMRNNLLHIGKTYKRLKRKDVISTPKTDNSERTIAIPNFLKEEVKEYLSSCYGIPDDQRIFTMVDRTVQKRFKKFSVKAGVKTIRVHDLRHSHAAYLIFKNVQPFIIKERFGHKDIRTTLNIYGHLYPSQQTMIANMLDDERKIMSQEVSNE